MIGFAHPFNIYWIHQSGPITCKQNGFCFSTQINAPSWTQPSSTWTDAPDTCCSRSSCAPTPTTPIRRRRRSSTTSNSRYAHCTDTHKLTTKLLVSKRIKICRLLQVIAARHLPRPGRSIASPFVEVELCGHTEEKFKTIVYRKIMEKDRKCSRTEDGSIKCLVSWLKLSKTYFLIYFCLHL